MLDEVESVAKAMVYAYGGEAVLPRDKEDAVLVISWLNQNGWRLAKASDAEENVSEGPIQRALGIDNG